MSVFEALHYWSCWLGLTACAVSFLVRAVRVLAGFQQLRRDKAYDDQLLLEYEVDLHRFRRGKR